MSGNDNRIRQKSSNSPQQSRKAQHWVSLLLGWLLCFGASRCVADFLTFQVTNSPNPTLRFSFLPNPSSYYILEASTDLDQFTPSSIAFGASGPAWDYPLASLTLPPLFWRGQSVSIFAPLDSDGDGMDDVFELERSDVLNPLNPADAATISPTNGGLTWLQVYLQIFGRNIPDVDVYSREVSLFNGESPPLTSILEVYSRELSIFNADIPLVVTEAISREVSVFNGELPPLTEFLEVYSREVSVFNYDSPTAAYEAISREVSILNDISN